MLRRIDTMKHYWDARETTETPGNMNNRELQ
jgi:hypothetical protein